ncbi:MAG: response regulator transcription factor [Rhizobacter sp.]|nr:response regulator transcription factor [Rhizobacter sp.]
MPTSAPLTILVVDDHAIVREGLRRILEGAGRAWTVYEAAGGFQAIEMLRRQPVGVVVADISMPGMSGLELIRRLRDEQPRLPVLVLSMHAEEQYVTRAFKAGANGYLTKDRAGDELVAAVSKVAAGGAYVTASLAEQMVLGLHRNGTGTAGREALSDREFEVLRRIVAGQRLSTIADELHLSVKTVSSHKRRMLDKLGLSSTAALIRYGMELGLRADGPPT